MKDPKLNKEIKNINNQSIAIIGHMGSGKSVFGKIISKKLKLEHFDSDVLIEQNSGKTIQDIFKIYGEEEFRRIEEKTILNLNDKKNIVLSLGGGSILSSKIRKFLIRKFFTVFLDTDISVLANRLKNSIKRPLILNTDIEKKIYELDTQRRKYYLIADFKIDDCGNLKEMTTIFLQNYKNYHEKNN